MVIQEPNLDIRHRSGKSNVVADALSRNSVLVPDVFKIVAHSLSSDVHSCEADIGKLQREDPELSPIWKVVLSLWKMSEREVGLAGS